MPNTSHAYMGMYAYMYAIYEILASTMQEVVLYTYLTYTPEQIWLLHYKYSSHCQQDNWAYRSNSFA